MPGEGNAAFRAVVTGHVQGLDSVIRLCARRAASASSVRLPTCPMAASRLPPRGIALLLRRFLAWLRKGPPGAYVRDVEVSWTPPTGSYTRFDVDF